MIENRTPSENAGQEEQTVNESETVAKKPKKRNWPAIIAIFLLAMLRTTLFTAHRFSDQGLVHSYYKVPAVVETVCDEDELDQYQGLFHRAHEFLQSKQYLSAIEAFKQLTILPPPLALGDDIIYYQEDIEWNYVLARLGASETNGDFRDRLAIIAEDPEHTYHEPAEGLQARLGSFWRGSDDAEVN